MARAWHYVYGDDPDDQDAPHLEVEFRPGHTIEITAVSDGAAVSLVGMPYEAFEEMVREIREYHLRELALEAAGIA